MPNDDISSKSWRSNKIQCLAINENHGDSDAADLSVSIDQLQGFKGNSKKQKVNSNNHIQMDVDQEDEAGLRIDARAKLVEMQLKEVDAGHVFPPRDESLITLAEKSENAESDEDDKSQANTQQIQVKKTPNAILQQAAKTPLTDNTIPTEEGQHFETNEENPAIMKIAKDI